MKLFFIILLTIIMCLIGLLSTAFYFSIQDFEWYHVVLQIGSLFTVIPTSNYWFRYFKKLYKYENI